MRSLLIFAASLLAISCVAAQAFEEIDIPLEGRCKADVLYFCSHTLTVGAQRSQETTFALGSCRTGVLCVLQLGRGRYIGRSRQLIHGALAAHRRDRECARVCLAGKTAHLHATIPVSGAYEDS